MDPCSTISDRVAAAAESIRRRWSCPATTAAILGTGLGDLADEVASSAALPYSDIPGFPHSTALAHKGRLVCGEFSGTPVLMMQGRCHLYEGYSLDDVTLPVRVLAALGIKTLIVTNAAGGLNPNYSTGDVMLIDDHINLMAPWDRPLACRPNYDRSLAESALSAARKNAFHLQRGVYIGVLGPTYETRAEYRAFRRLGGDCVGMSTVPEVLAAASCGLRVLGLSTVTNVATPDAPKKVSADEVVEVAAIARPRVQTIIQELVAPRPGN
jgi:purine-nucleoside phosphorylase